MNARLADKKTDMSSARECVTDGEHLVRSIQQANLFA